MILLGITEDNEQVFALEEGDQNVLYHFDSQNTTYGGVALQGFTNIIVTDYKGEKE